MRRPTHLAIVLVLVACKKHEPESVDAAPPPASVAPPPSASARRDATRDAAAPPRGERLLGELPAPGPAPTGASLPTTLPAAPDELGVVAIGRTYGSRILWAHAIGSRFWLSARNLDAFADGDGALAKGPDLLAKLPYKPGVHRMDVVGAWPHLFAMRVKNVNGRMESPEATAFVYHAEDGGPGTWTQAAALPDDMFPDAFFAYRDGAVEMRSQIERNAGPFYSPERAGTTFTFIGPDGKVSPLDLHLPRTFMAWDAASDGSAVALVGTIAAAAKTKDDIPSGSGVHVLLAGPDGAVARAQVERTTDATTWLELYATQVRARGGVALEIPARQTGDDSAKRALTAWLVGSDGKPHARAFAGNEWCRLAQAEHVGDVVYAIRDCFGEHAERDVVRLGPDGKTQRIALPRIAGTKGGGFHVATAADGTKVLGCGPTWLSVRDPDDLWVVAKCGGDAEPWDQGPAVPILLRRGHAQAALEIP
jgi:hypothetical protein